jgi:hypothetical protein
MGLPVRALVQYDQHMQRRPIRLFFVAAALLGLTVACGSSSGTKNASTRKSASPPPFKANFSAPTHHPIVKKNWPITVTVTNLSGKPIAATLRMNVLLGDARVGRIDNGKIYHFVGRYRENITWPQKSVGYPLTLQAVVGVKEKTKALLWAVSVVNK